MTAWLTTHPNGAVVRTARALAAPPAPVARRFAQQFERGYVEVLELAGGERR